MDTLTAMQTLSRMIGEHQRLVQVRRYAHLADTELLQEELEALEAAYDALTATLD